MSETETETENRIRPNSILNVLNLIHDKDAKLGLVASIFILILFTAVWFGQSFGGIDSLESFTGLLYLLLRLLIAAAIFFIFFKAIDGTFVPKVIVWYFTIVVLMTASIFWMQSILRTPVPYLAEARCFADPWSQGCPLGIAVASEVKAIPSTNSTEAISNSTEPPEYNRVFVQFAGSISRSSIIDASLKLVEKGWNVQGADRGGERTAQAVGVDQVRYFHEDDADIGARLARQYNSIADWNGFDPLSVAHVRGYETQVPIGHLEVWTSVD